MYVSVRSIQVEKREREREAPHDIHRSQSNAVLSPSALPESTLCRGMIAQTFTEVSQMCNPTIGGLTGKGSWVELSKQIDRSDISGIPKRGCSMGVNSSTN